MPYDSILLQDAVGIRVNKPLINAPISFGWHHGRCRLAGGRRELG
jgi:hypothetical protein